MSTHGVGEAVGRIGSQGMKITPAILLPRLQCLSILFFSVTYPSTLSKQPQKRPRQPFQCPICHHIHHPSNAIPLQHQKCSIHHLFKQHATSPRNSSSSSSEQVPQLLQQILAHAKLSNAWFVSRPPESCPRVQGTSPNRGQGCCRVVIGLELI